MTLRTKIEVGLGAAVLGWMLLFGHFPNWREQQRLETQPRVLEQTKKAKKAKRRPLTREQAAELCSGLQPIVRDKLPVERDGRGGRVVGVEVADAIEPHPSNFRLRIEDQVPALLDSLKIEKLPHGGRADVELTIGAERPIVTVYPNPRPFLEAMSRFRLSALVGISAQGAGESGQVADQLLVVPRIDWRGLRTGRIDYGASAVYCPSRSVIAGLSVGFE